MAAEASGSWSGKVSNVGRLEDAGWGLNGSNLASVSCGCWGRLDCSMDSASDGTLRSGVGIEGAMSSGPGGFGCMMLSCGNGRCGDSTLGAKVCSSILSGMVWSDD